MDTNIEIIDNGITAKVLLNGRDISDEVSRVEYEHEGGNIAEVKLIFMGQDVKICAPCCKTKFPQAAFTALTDKQREKLLEENPSLANSLRRYFETNKNSSAIDTTKKFNET